MYTNNPHMPKIRRDAVLFANKYGVRCAARHFGFSPGAIILWRKKAKKISLHPIPTESSRPHRHPEELKEDIVKRIVQIRLDTKRTSEVVHQHLKNEGVKVSLSSVHRTLDRKGLLKKRSPWKRYHPPVDRPYPIKPGSLVQLDTIHLMTGSKTRIYVMTLIDVYSRQTYAKCYEKLNSATSVRFLIEAQKHFLFKFEMIQTDHGPEFGKWFQDRTNKYHRYTRIGKPNDNAHIERFNRTLQEECLDILSRDVSVINCKLKSYLKYYNEVRLHLGIELKTPMQIIRECSQAIG
jgi:transposase InsO family protein